MPQRQTERERTALLSFIPNESPPIGVLEKALRSWWGDPWEPQDGWCFALGGLVSLLVVGHWGRWGWWMMENKSDKKRGVFKQQWGCALPCSWVWLVAYGASASLRIILVNPPIKGGFTSYYVNSFKLWGFVFKYIRPWHEIKMHRFSAFCVLICHFPTKEEKSKTFFLFWLEVLDHGGTHA